MADEDLFTNADVCNFLNDCLKRKYTQVKRKETIGKPRFYLKYLTPEERKLHKLNYIKEWRRNNKLNKYNHSNL